jgi:hypothetical protein
MSRLPIALANARATEVDRKGALQEDVVVVGPRKREIEFSEQIIGLQEWL